MYILITYDVSTKDKNGAKRLRQVAKYCQNYGQRIQNSVFKCKIENYMLPSIENDLKNLMDLKKDNIKIFKLGKNIDSKIISLGKNTEYDIEDTLIF